MQKTRIFSALLLTQRFKKFGCGEFGQYLQLNRGSVDITLAVPLMLDPCLNMHCLL